MKLKTKNIIENNIDELNEIETTQNKLKIYSYISITLSVLAIIFSIITIYFSKMPLSFSIFIIRFSFSFFAFLLIGIATYFASLKFSKNIISIISTATTTISCIFAIVSVCV